MTEHRTPEEVAWEEWDAFCSQRLAGEERTGFLATASATIQRARADMLEEACAAAINRGLSTGHADTVEDLVVELAGCAEEARQQRDANRAGVRRLMAALTDAADRTDEARRAIQDNAKREHGYDDEAVRRYANLLDTNMIRQVLMEAMSHERSHALAGHPGPPRPVRQGVRVRQGLR